MATKFLSSESKNSMHYSNLIYFLKTREPKLIFTIVRIDSYKFCKVFPILINAIHLFNVSRTKTIWNTFDCHIMAGPIVLDDEIYFVYICEFLCEFIIRKLQNCRLKCTKSHSKTLIVHSKLVLSLMVPPSGYLWSASNWYKRQHRYFLSVGTTAIKAW